MNQLEIIHKKIQNNSSRKQTAVGAALQKTEQVEESINTREVRGEALATTRVIYRIQNSDTYYVQSKRSDNIFYFVRFNPSVFEWCSCPDNSMRGEKCKHIWSIEFAIRLGIIKETDRLPTEVKVKKKVVTTIAAATKPLPAKSYTEDDYSF